LNIVAKCYGPVTIDQFQTMTGVEQGLQARDE
jgi:hypothetical protein